VRKEIVRYCQASYGVSERRACRASGMHRSVQQYEGRPDGNGWLRARLKELAEQRRRFGAPRLYYLLRREGHVVNHKRVERVYREEGLSLRRKRRRKRAVQPRVPLERPGQPNQRWSMDFVSDQLYWGRRFRCLAIVDDATKEAPVVQVGVSLTGEHITETLDRLAETYGLPQALRMDNGPEFQSKALDDWAYRHGVKLQFTRPGKPTDNAYIESFIGKLRDECLNESWFTTLEEAKRVIEDWRVDYNENRPHSALGGMPPREFGEKQRTMLNSVGV
jgi:putative transposase